MHYISALILLWLLSAAALDLQLAAGQSHQSGLNSVCRVSDPESLVRCLEDPATDILIQADVHAGAAFQKYAGTNSPLQVTRNVTIQGPPNRQPDDWPLLDFGLVDGALQICSTCIMTLTRIVMTGERKGTGPVYDIFTGHPGSRVQSIDTYRLRLACTPPEMQLKSIQTMQRSALYPNRSTAQDVDLRDVTYRGKVYKDSVWADYISFDVPYSYNEGSSNDEGGYAQTGQRSVRLCEGYVSKACLEKMTANACVYQMIDSLRSPPQRSGMAPGTAAAIAVCLSTGFLLAAGFAAWWWRRRVAQHKHDNSSKSLKAQRSSPLLRTGTGTSMTGSGSSGPHGSGGPMGKPLGRTTGWELMDSQTAPSYDTVQDSAIELGTFIGAGSFGKVFKGRWNGMDVAVKVIEHSGSSAEAVQQEMEMMMSFQHKNIVRAFHCLTYVNRDGPLESEYSGSVISVQGSAGGNSMSFTRGQSSAGSFAVTRMGSIGGDIADMPSDTGAGVSTAAGGMLARQHSRSPVQDAAPTITEGVAFCQPAHWRHSPLQAVLAGGAAAPAATSPDCTRVRFSDPDSSDAAQQASSRGLQRSGSAPAPGGKQPPAQATDSYGSSIDCKCVAADLKRSKSSQSHREVLKRFESWLVLEYCDKGCVSHYLGQWPAPCEVAGDASSLLRVLQVLRDAAQGLQELHTKKVVHGDLNARNVLVASCSDAPSGVTAKLADLGLSRSIKQHQTHRTTNTIGTMSHMPPEMLRLGQMSVFADVYALGIMMWELYTGEDAFQRLLHPGQFFETVVLQDLRPVIPQGMPLDYQLLMQHCWATEPSARPTISRVLECLDYMIRERKQQLQGATVTIHAAGAVGTTGAVQRGLAASDPLPGLLASSPPRKQSWWRHQQLLKVQGSEASASLPGTSNPPSQASSGALPSLAYPHSNSLLPVLDVEAPADSSAPHHAPGRSIQSALGQAQQLQSNQRQVGQQRQLHQQQPVQEETPSGYTSQPLPAVHSSAGSNHGFSFFRNGSWRRRNSTNLPRADDRDGSVHAPHESGTPRDSSSGRLPTFFDNLRQGSWSLRDACFESRHGSFGTRREGSQNDLKDHAWFV